MILSEDLTQTEAATNDGNQKLGGDRRIISVCWNYSLTPHVQTYSSRKDKKDKYKEDLFPFCPFGTPSVSFK